METFVSMFLVWTVMFKALPHQVPLTITALIAFFLAWFAVNAVFKVTAIYCCIRLR